ncbi:hypothetical protein JXQ31_06000 [candidate division KSB1 bacterium]|nr:hypothetical protein [candidate division KSB1 bacterium]
MLSVKNSKQNRGWILVLVLTAFGLGLLPALAGETEGGESPDAVFKAAQAAGAKKDFSALVQLVAPSERPMLAFGTDMGVGMFVEFYEGEKAEELKKKYQDIQTKYGIKLEEENEGEKLQITSETPQEVIDAHMLKRAKKLYGHVDVVKYVPDLMNILFNMPEMAEESVFPQEELTGLNIDGDHATGNAGEKTITFIREDGRWYLTSDVMN